MTTAKARPARSLLSRPDPHRPRWRAWPFLFGLWLLAWAPLRLTRALGLLLGDLMYRLNAKRRRIAQVNFDLCFPELTARRKALLVRRHFRLMGQSYLDVAFLAWASERRFRRKTRVTGLEHLHASVARGRRVILLAPHCVGMNVGGIVISRYQPVFSMYKPQRGAVVNWLLHKARSRYGAPLVARQQGLRPVLRGLDQGMIFYYLPDEDFGPKHSVFAPFFGVTTATLPILGRLAELAQADVIPCFTRLLPRGRGYEVVLHAPLAHFPSGDRIEDATHMNAAMERGIREMPEQYMWTFKLFKTRPHGARSPYG